MVKIKNIAFVAVIGIVVFLSGCTGNQETKITGTPTAVVTTAVQPSPVKTPEGPYTFSVTEIKTLPDCIKSGETKPCTLINLEVRNNNPGSLDIKIVKDDVMLKSGKLLGNRYDRDIGLSDQCVRLAGLEFKLNANANQNVALCYPVAHTSDAPSLNIAALVNGERKEYTFDLIQYGLTS